MIIPHTQLKVETLDAVIEEFVTRDGTEMSEAATKVAAVRRGLDSGKLVIVFDTEDSTCNILTADQAREWLGED